MLGAANSRVTRESPVHPPGGYTSLTTVLSLGSLSVNTTTTTATNLRLVPSTSYGCFRLSYLVDTVGFDCLSWLVVQSISPNCQPERPPPRPIWRYQRHISASRENPHLWLGYLQESEATRSLRGDKRNFSCPAVSILGKVHALVTEINSAVRYLAAGLNFSPPSTCRYQAPSPGRLP